MKPRERISRATAGLILSSPFYATLALGLNVAERDGIDTMATDGESLFFNPGFVAALTDAELRGVVAHEVMHVANLHHTRRGSRDPERWNVACDYVINSELVAEGFTLPAGALIDSRFAGMSADQVFAALDRETPPGDDGGKNASSGDETGDDGNGAPDPAGTGGVVDAAAPGDESAMRQAELDAMARVIQAATIAKNAGQESAAGSRLADAIRKPVVDWRAVLLRYVDDAARHDYAWSRPNRRHVASGLYLPGKVKDGMQSLAVIIDTSGSIDTAALGAFMGELQAAVDHAAPAETVVIQCDSAVQRVDTFAPGDLLSVNLAGGGGTDMSPALEMCGDASAVIVFTDCEFWAAPIDPGAPVLWARWGNCGTVPAFGELIDVA